MLLKPTVASRPSSTLSVLVDTANMVAQATPRAYTAAVTAVTPGVWPGPSPLPADAIPVHGGWANGFPSDVLVAGSGPHFTYITFGAADPLVRVDSAYSHETWVPDGLSWKLVKVAQKGGAGDGVTPWPTQPNGYGSFSTNDPTTPAGTTFDVQHNLTYLSGATAIVTYSYQTDGTAPAKPDDLVVAPPPPPAHETQSMATLDGGAPAVFQQTKTTVEGTQTAFGDTVGAGEAVLQGGGTHTQAVVTELNAIGANIVKPWEDIANDPTTPANLKRAAEQNVGWTFRELLDLSVIGHNTQSNAVLARVDANFETYRQYGNYAWTRSADTILGISDWIAAGRPN